MDKAYLNQKIETETELSHIGEWLNTILIINSENKDMANRLEKSERYKMDNDIGKHSCYFLLLSISKPDAD